MRANEIKKFLKRLYASERGYPRSPVLLLGGPGIGKSTCVREFAEETARELGKEFIDYDDTQADKVLADPERYFVFHNLPLVGCEPSDLTGHPRIVGESVRYLPLAWAKVMSRCDGCLFLDDFLDTQRMDVMSAAYRIFLERRIGYVYLSPGVQVVAASNTPEYSTLSQMMPLPLANRCIIINVSPPTPEEWASWMDSKYKEWDRRVFTFLKRFEDSEYIFSPPKGAETLEEYPTPRSWSKLALLLPKKIEMEAMEGIVGEEMAQKFKAFCELRVDLEKLAQQPERFRQFSLDSKYVAVYTLATTLSEENFSRYDELVRVVASDSREWLVILLLTMGPYKRAKFIAHL
ncbi:MAG: hypothetical protein QXR87_06010, partial [Candidatus Hadarchaeales archaeon]